MDIGQTEQIEKAQRAQALALRLASIEKKIEAASVLNAKPLIKEYMNVSRNLMMIIAERAFKGVENG